MTFNIGETVIYGSLGICTVKEIRLTSFITGQPKEEYYVLSRKNSPGSTCFVPVKGDESKKLRSPLSQKEILSLLNTARNISFSWIDHRQQRADFFRDILSKGISPELVALLSCLYLRRKALNENKKALSSTDEDIFRQAEKMLHDELAYSLQIEADEVNDYIAKVLS